MDKLVDYPRLDYKHHQHFKRLKTHVQKFGLMCQECGGAGDYIDEYIDNGICPEPIYSSCGWCQGIGLVPRWIRGQWLKYKRLAKVGG